MEKILKNTLFRRHVCRERSDRSKCVNAGDHVWVCTCNFLIILGVIPEVTVS